VERTAILQLIEPWATRRKRELRVEIQNLDVALASVTIDIGEERRKSGLSFYGGLPTSMKSPRMLALQAGLNALSHWHSETLREYADLV